MTWIIMEFACNICGVKHRRTAGLRDVDTHQPKYSDNSRSPSGEYAFLLFSAPCTTTMLFLHKTSLFGCGVNPWINQVRDKTSKREQRTNHAVLIAYCYKESNYLETSCIRTFDYCQDIMRRNTGRGKRYRKDDLPGWKGSSALLTTKERTFLWQYSLSFTFFIAVRSHFTAALKHTMNQWERWNESELGW